ncbi:MAG: gfo/Idh/MocA family oxidoreductase [Deltaproteobacteria bacterium]|nr:MAG: gfo/Idh/MocA family oxidoreductase [Deltaproteobacteria bacterium]
MIRIGVIGYGYWGPNVVRNFNIANGSQVTMVCDMNQQSLKKVKKTYPHVRITTDCGELIKDPKVDAVAIATPVFTHYEFAKMALAEGKSVFVEKPFTYTNAQGEELIGLAEKKKLKIMVDHTFLYTGAVKKIKQLVEDNVLGNLYYFDSMRVNLGLFQHDVNVVWDLAPHDISIMDYVLEERPLAVIATGAGHFGRGLEDIAYLTFYYNNNIIAHINVNWLSPVKVRTTLIGGQKKMLVWNDLEPDEKLKIYDKGVQVRTKEGKYNLLVDYRSGDMWAPKIEQTEALKLMAESFVDYIENGIAVVNDGIAGLNIVKMLTAANKSLNNKGKTVYL